MWFMVMIIEICMYIGVGLAILFGAFYIISHIFSFYFENVKKLSIKLFYKKKKFSKKDLSIINKCRDFYVSRSQHDKVDKIDSIIRKWG